MCIQPRGPDDGLVGAIATAVHDRLVQTLGEGPEGATKYSKCRPPVGGAVLVVVTMVECV